MCLKAWAEYLKCEKENFTSLSKRISLKIYLINLKKYSKNTLAFFLLQFQQIPPLISLKRIFVVQAEASIKFLSILLKNFLHIFRMNWSVIFCSKKFNWASPFHPSFRIKFAIQDKKCSINFYSLPLVSLSASDSAFNYIEGLKYFAGKSESVWQQGMVN